MKILYVCDGAPAPCLDCQQRHDCQFWNHHISRKVWRILLDIGLRVTSKKLNPGQTRKDTQILYVRKIANIVIRQTRENRRNWIYAMVNGIIMSLPSVKALPKKEKVWSTGVKKSPKRHTGIASRIFLVKLEDLIQ